MSASFLTFQTFTDPDIATEVAEQLQANGIACQVENNRTFFDPSYANNAFESDISLKIPADNFEKAHIILEGYYAQEADKISSDYHLFSFSNAELTDILVHPDEWGYLDQQLALKILRERGMTIEPATIQQLKARRNDKLAQPEAAAVYRIYAGYTLAILGGVMGVIIACSLLFPKKTLPNGQSIYMYREADRNHGSRILLIACISTLFWVAFRWYTIQ